MKYDLRYYPDNNIHIEHLMVVRSDCRDGPYEVYEDTAILATGLDLEEAIAVGEVLAATRKFEREDTDANDKSPVWWFA